MTGDYRHWEKDLMDNDEVKVKRANVDLLGKATRYSENPFFEELQATLTTRKKRTLVKGGKAIVDDETGEYEHTAEIVAVKEVDSESFVKIFTKEVGATFGFTGKAQEIFMCIVKQLQDYGMGKDTIFLNELMIKKYYEQQGWKTPATATIRRALTQLIDARVIARNALDVNLYFINPNIMFNGDRVRFVKEYRIQKMGIPDANKNTSRTFANSRQQQLTHNPDEQVDLEDYIDAQKKEK